MMGKIYKNVKRYSSGGGVTRHYGDMSEEDFKDLVKNLKYDKELDMWFSKNAQYAISHDSIPALDKAIRNMDASSFLDPSNYKSKYAKDYIRYCKDLIAKARKSSVYGFDKFYSFLDKEKFGYIHKDRKNADEFMHIAHGVSNVLQGIQIEIARKSSGR